MTRRQAITAILGLGAATLISACDRQAPEPGASDTASDPVEPARAELAYPWKTRPTATAAQPGAVEDRTFSRELPPRRYPGTEISFRFSGLNPAGQEAVRAEIVKFFELTGITVWPDDGQGTPDIWQGGGLWVPVFAAKGNVLELDDYVASWPEWEDFYPDVRRDVTYDGHVFAVPFRTNYRGSVVFRPSMFESAGIAPEPPGTWDELNEITPRLTVKDGDNFEQAGINLQHHTQVYEDWLHQAGGKIFSADLGRPTNNSPAGLIALHQHVRHGLVDDTVPIEGMYSGVPNLHTFCAGRVAIQQLWPGNVGNCESNAPEIFADLGVGPPLEGPRQRALQLFVDKYIPWKLTKHPDAVFETLKYFASPEPNYRIHVHDIPMPCRAAMEDYELYEREPYGTFASNVKYGRLRQVVPEHFDVQPAMSRWVEKAALGELGISEALRGMDEEVQAILGG